MLISCIMPTYNRRTFVAHAVRYFLRQEYAEKELIIIDDGTDCIKDLIPDDPIIHYYRLDKKITLGAKLNMACEYASGDLIAHWDDDDWYAPWRLQYQYDELMKDQKDLCGINKLLYFDLRSYQALQYIYPSDQRVWMIGSSLFYKKDLWTTRRFADIDVGMDGLFVWSVPPERIKVLRDFNYAIHMIHDRNVSPKKTDGLWWHPISADRIHELLDTDMHCYRNDGFVKNIYACLVHEQWECVADLIQNLHHHDPDSTILLYNGSQHTDFLDKKFPFEKFGVVIHPSPQPMKHGYLHQFAFDCMEYAQKNFDFDTITIVDSDQLQIKKGYSYFLSQHLSRFPHAGMFSSAPQRVGPEDTKNLVAMQAFKEFALWKPLLSLFPEGENKFVHWTFWPGSVFTRNAIRDLLELVKNNIVLQDILQKTKIWATEEIILPTLIKLLGYEIAANPVSYEFIKYKKQMTVGDITIARTKNNSFWIHPVIRKFDDPVRKYIRNTSYQQTKETPKPALALDRSKYILIPDTEKDREKKKDREKEKEWLRSSKKIEGWLQDAEAELLMESAREVLMQLDGPHDFVEVGSYHGKSTVLLGGMAKICSVDIKIYSVDPHDGRLGDADLGIQQYPPSLGAFKKNIRDAGISGQVEIIQNVSAQVIWHKPISFLLIDGMHDYENVLLDFNKFSPWIRSGGYLVFHDYADYFPGVRRFVDGLMQNHSYQRINISETLVVFKKI
jgi:glycosyltransferase involved in cell wall biosynthesis/predicted O-methyltransferase YrrM